ncbi:hypothetical protein FDUTEX481_06348 [Tolypothrix sp. PCC 7601]|nr:hypothetical protein FDUTEX481_06348 [Tolypothrix sp. PCC 7601]
MRANSESAFKRTENIENIGNIQLMGQTPQPDLPTASNSIFAISTPT